MSTTDDGARSQIGNLADMMLRESERIDKLEKADNAVAELVQQMRIEAMKPEHVKHAVAAGIHQAVSDPQLWAAALTAMQAHARDEAGGWLLGSLKAVVSRGILFIGVGLGVYAIGGWSALAALFKSGTHP